MKKKQSPQIRRLTNQLAANMRDVIRTMTSLREQIELEERAGSLRVIKRPKTRGRIDAEFQKSKRVRHG